MSKVNFDKSFWPESGTTVPAMPTDLDDLWGGDLEDQASTFVAHALISNPPRMCLSLNARPEHAEILVYLWDIGGDCLVIHEPLPELIIESAHFYYDKITSNAQAEDVQSHIKALQEVMRAASEASAHLEKLLADFKASTSR
jgi:hypothetical protein